MALPILGLLAGIAKAAVATIGKAASTTATVAKTAGSTALAMGKGMAGMGTQGMSSPLALGRMGGFGKMLAQAPALANTAGKVVGGLSGVTDKIKGITDNKDVGDWASRLRESQVLKEDSSQAPTQGQQRPIQPLNFNNPTGKPIDENTLKLIDEIMKKRQMQGGIYG